MHDLAKLRTSLEDTKKQNDVVISKHIYLSSKVDQLKVLIDELEEDWLQWQNFG